MKKSLSLLTLALLVSTSSFAQNANDVIIPRPSKVMVTGGELNLPGILEMDIEGSKTFRNFLESELSTKFDINNVKNAAVDFDVDIDPTENIPAEGYELEIEDDKIAITASTEQGAFYGFQSLVQLLNAGKTATGFTLTCQEIDDAPRFPWRSYMIDESRYFYGETELKKLIDELAALKINVLHWHLTDDAGWRIEIKKYPLLTEVGSYRKDSEIETWGSGKTSGEPHSGFYTQKQIKEIMRYAAERHVKLVPEIEMPGHSSAAVAAYPWLSTKNEVIEVPVKFGKHYYTYDVIDPRVQKFLKDVVKEVYDLFDTDVIHIGGDEVRFDHWEQDADMIAHKKAKGYNSFMDIQIEFSNDMSRFIESLGGRMMGWNEILGTNLHEGEIRFADASTKIAPNVIVHFWKGDIESISKAAKDGYDIVNSYHTYTYLDYSYTQIPLKLSYSFDPVPEGLAPQYHHKIIGLGTQMWREWAPTVERVQEQSFPRVAAYSEVGWSQKENKDYESFLERLAPVAEGWRSRGISVNEY